MNYKNSQKTMNKMAILSPYISIITLNINEWNSPIKRQRMAECIKKNKIQWYSAYKTFTLDLETHTD